MAKTSLVTVTKEEMEAILLSSPPLERIDDLFAILSPKPNYIGPGPWLAYIQERARSGQNQ